MTATTISAQAEAPLRILLVDDNDAVRGVIERLLCRLGHAVRPCASAEEARVASGEHFEVALVDLNLGQSDEEGWEVIAHLREQRPSACFVLTSGSRPSLDQRIEGETLFLKKPFSRGDLVDLLRTARSRLSLD